MSKSQNEQLLVVDSCNISEQSSQWKTLYPDMLQAFVTNKSDKTVKNMNVGFLAYDSNGYPLKIKTQFSYSGGNFEFIGNADNINLVSGAQFGSSVGWKLDEKHGISTIKACVKDATFYDGTTWNNPYYRWIVDGQWEFTINSVTTTKKRNQFSDKKPAQVLLIDYSYKNLGYVDNIQDLYLGTFTIMDEKGEVADTYPATISNYPKPTPVGGTCSNAITAYGVKNQSSYITIKVEKYKSGYAGKETATFKVPIE